MKLVLLMLLFSVAWAIPVYVMMPLDSVTNDNQLKDYSQLDSWFGQLAQGKVAGIMTDVWWGIAEPSPGAYNFSAWDKMFALAKSHGLQVQATMSFHQCGGNVGDTCNIPLPSWVLNVNGAWYMDSQGHEDKEYISLAVDHSPLFGGRTPLQLYAGYVKAFATHFSALMGSTIKEVQVGLGPCGELRYPSYQLDRWSFPGIGEFQCYSDAMVQNFATAARAAGHPEWNAPPSDAGTYNSAPQDTSFFQDNGGYQSDYGKFFLSWYSGVLIQHADDVLGAIASSVNNLPLVSTKVSGVHWWYKSNSHAAEATAGYYNSNGNDGYEKIAAIMKKHHIHFDFTCLEMRDSEQCQQCGPEELVHQTKEAAAHAGIPYCGENALPRFDQTAYQQILYQATSVAKISAFTYLRLGSDLMSSSNWGNFVDFVKQMAQLG